MDFLYIPGYIQDGCLDNKCSRIVIYKDQLAVTYKKSCDHNYLLRSLVAKYRFKKEDVISNAIRLYFRQEKKRIVISGVRKLDDEDLARRWEQYLGLIKKEIR